MTRTYRIAVLECDTPFPSVNEKRGSYGDIFRDLLTKGLKNEALGDKGKDVSLDLSKWDVVTAQEYPNIEDVDGFLLTGSKQGLHQMHRDAVLEIPEGLVSLGSSSRCEVQGLYKPGRIISFQAHPEFDDFIMQEIMEARYAQQIFSKEMYEEGITRARAHHDGLLVAAKIWEFLL
ncbi:hypothetical protein LB505_001581 [Fusarium chuoi]|nr:hypothetical protein LB505_001581 [Fusarium chuoi]